MLNEEQQSAEVKITGAVAVVALQCITRLASVGALKDMELAPVGQARDSLVAALQDGTGVNYDLERARQEALQRHRLAQAQKQAEEAPAEAEAEASAEAPAEAPAEVEAPAETVAEVADQAEAEQQAVS